MLADLTTAEAQYKAAGAASQRDGHSGESQPVTDDPAVTVGSTLAVGLSNIAFLRREAAKRLHALVCGVVQCGTSAAQDTAAAVRDVDATAPPAYVALVVLAYLMPSHPCAPRLCRACGVLVAAALASGCCGRLRSTDCWLGNPAASRSRKRTSSSPRTRCVWVRWSVDGSCCELRLLTPPVPPCPARTHPQELSTHHRGPDVYLKGTPLTTQLDLMQLLASTLASSVLDAASVPRADSSTSSSPDQARPRHRLLSPSTATAATPGTAPARGVGASSRPDSLGAGAGAAPSGGVGGFGAVMGPGSRGGLGGGVVDDDDDDAGLLDLKDAIARSRAKLNLSAVSPPE